MTTVLHRLTTVLSLLALTFTALPASAKPAAKKCQIMDGTPENVYEVRFAYVPESDATLEASGSSLGSVDTMEVEGDWAFSYYRYSAGVLDLNLDLRATIFHDTLNGMLPSQVAEFALDGGWGWRGNSGLSAQLRLAPGLYSDLDEFSGDSFNCPVSVSLIKAFNPSISGQIGFQWRPGFARAFMPLVGVVWQANEYVKLDLRCPRSKVTVYIPDNWNTHLGLDWDAMSYSMSDGRDLISLDDFRAYWGVGYRVSNQVHVNGDLGFLFHRTVSFEADDQHWGDDLEVERNFFLRASVAAPF